MGWFRRRSAPPPAPDRDGHEEPVEVGGERLVFWKAKSEEVEGEIYGPVWIADANDPNVTLEEHAEWLTWDQALGSAASRSRTCEPGSASGGPAEHALSDARTGRTLAHESGP